MEITFLVPMKAKFFVTWHGGSLSSDCEYDPIENDVTNFEPMEAPLDILHIEEFILLPNGKKIYDFKIEGYYRG